MPGDVMMQILKRLRDLEDEVKHFQTKQRNIDALAMRDGVTAPSSVTGIGILYIDTADGLLKIRYGDGTTVTLGAASGASTFLDLADTPSAYTGAANYFVRVNSGTAALVFGTVDWTDVYNKPSSFTPAAHGGSHHSGSADPVGTVTPTAGAIPYADGSGLLDAWISPAGTALRGRAAFPTPDFAVNGGTVTMGTVWPRYSGVPTAGAVAYWTGAGTVAHAPFGTADVATLAGTQTFTNKTLTSPTITIRDNVLTIQDDSDPTKQMQFQLSGITASNTRTLTVPNASGVLALLGLAQTFSALQTFSSGINLGNETLTVYDEGTWTPAIEGSSSNPTVSYGGSLSGTYVRFNNMVFYSFRIPITTISGGSGDIRITLPFTAVTPTGPAPIRLNGVDVSGTPISVLFNPNSGSAYGLIYGIYDNGAEVAQQISGLANGDSLQSQGFFFV